MKTPNHRIFPGHALRSRLAGLTLAVGLVLAQTGLAQHIDADIEHQIAAVQAIDNHAHPLLAPPLDATDRDFDALPVSGLEAQSDPVALRADFPQLASAWKALYGFELPPPLDADGMKRLAAARARVLSHHGERFPAWVLDQAGIGTVLANRVAMGKGLDAPRFRWVPYADALLFPLDNRLMASASPDRKALFPLEDQVRSRYLKDAGLERVPRSLNEYLSKVVTPTLERHKAGGAVAEKFEVAYLRSFDFGDPPRAAAERAYARWSGGGTPDAADYKLLQDYLFRYLALECGRLGLVVQIHAEGGVGSYFSVDGANPLRLEPLFNDPRLRQTRFVLLHGGWPFAREMGALLQKPNVFVDISSQSLLIAPRTQARWLREWLELEPEKVLFGTDGYPYSAEMGWAESTWIAARNAREALGLALTGMLEDNEINRQRAGEIAHLVLRDTATGLYRIQ